MRRKSAPIGSRYGRVCEELLDMGARIAVRSYTNCPQTGRKYYRPPAPATPATASSSGVTGASAGGTDASSAAACSLQQHQQAAPEVEFHASEFILYGDSGGRGKKEPTLSSSR